MSKRARDAENKKRKIARLRFRNLIRSVSLNRIWLVDLGDQKLSLNVKKNIALLVRTQRKIGLLTMAEKSLIRTHHTLRTTEDRKKLVSLMGGLTCFHKIPPKVRARLSKCVKFMVIGPGRKLIKEGDLPLMLYFVLTGEVEVTKRVYDQIKNTWVDRIEMISGPGDCLGDVEMIERCTRRHTYTSANVVELLVVFEEDFESVLRPVMEKQWTEKKSAIRALDYFNFFTRDQIMNACKLCVLRQFEPLETIYYQDKGHLSYVHFVISGECMILQCLKMMVSQRKGVKTFELTDITKDDTSSIFQDLTNTELLKILSEENNSPNKSALEIEKLIASEEGENAEQTEKTFDLKKMDMKSIEIKCGLYQPSSETEEHNTPTKTISKKSELSIQNDDIPLQITASSLVIDELEIKNEHKELQKITSDVEESFMPDSDTKKDYDMEDIDTSKQAVVATSTLEISQLRGNEIPDENIQLNKVSLDPKKKQQKRMHKKAALEDVSEEDSVDKRYSSEQTVSISSKRESSEGERKVNRDTTRRSTLQSLPNTIRESLSYSIRSGNISPLKRSFGNLENHFIDVGSLTFGGIFGIGEKLEHRVIMARTTVQCLMIPRFWLFERDQNPGNIWQRRRFYLDSTIPSRQMLFKDFLTTRQWQKFKKDLIQSNLNPNSTANPTRIQDVPIICRIVEASED